MNGTRIAVAGGGIGGLTVALALSRAGLQVDLFEQANLLGEIGAGLQLSPNATRCLEVLGLGEALRDVACVPAGKQIRLWSTGQRWKLFDLGNAAMVEYGAPYLMIHRADLLAVLVRGVREEGEKIVHLNARVAGFTQDDGGVDLRFEDGRSERYDILIAADGVHSVLRQSLGHMDHPSYTGCMAWRGLVPTIDLPARLREPIGTNWIGPGAHVITYPVRGANLLNFVGIVERDDWLRESWTEQGSVDECANDFRHWHDDVQFLISRLSVPFKWALMGREPLANWGKGRVTLLGDAAHPMLPFLAQGAGMAIEDAIVLARCLLLPGETLASRLRRYEHLRIGRTSRVVHGASEAGKRFHNPALADTAGAQEYVDREWNEKRTRERYDWLFSYDPLTVDLQ